MVSESTSSETTTKGGISTSYSKRTEIRLGKLSFFDLASSERVPSMVSSRTIPTIASQAGNKDTVNEQNLMEGQHINRSLAALGDVFQALVAKATVLERNNKQQRLQAQQEDGTATATAPVTPNDTNKGNAVSSGTPVTPLRSTPLPLMTSPTPNSPIRTPLNNNSNSNAKPLNAEIHIPYKNAKLTYLLKDSLGGNCRTMMIVTLAEEMNSYHHTMTILQNASKAMKIRNTPILNRVILPENYTKLVEDYKQQQQQQQPQQAPSSEPVPAVSASPMTILKQLFVEPLLNVSPVKKPRKILSINPTASPMAYNPNDPENNNGNGRKTYQLCIKSISLEDISSHSLPMLPSLKMEVGNILQKTNR